MNGVITGRARAVSIFILALKGEEAKVEEDEIYRSLTMISPTIATSLKKSGIKLDLDAAYSIADYWCFTSESNCNDPSKILFLIVGLGIVEAYTSRAEDGTFKAAVHSYVRETIFHLLGLITGFDEEMVWSRLTTCLKSDAKLVKGN